MCLTITSSVLSQNNLKKAEKFYASKAYKKAAEMYDDLLEKESVTDAKIYLDAANSHYLIAQMRQASIYYEKAYNLNNGLQEPNLSKYVRSLRSVKEYDKADRVYKSYLEKYGSKDELKKYLRERAVFDSILKSDTPSRYTLKNLDINTEYSDFGAVPFQNKIAFSSSRPGNAKELYAWNEQPFLSLFVSDTLQSGSLSAPKTLLKDAGTEFHDATFAFSEKDNTVYFTSSNTKRNKMILDEDSNNNFKLYRGKLIDGKIESKEPLYFNSNDFSVGHPFVGKDGTYLFFVSDMPGGYGEADIYYSKVYEDGMISNPKNAGDEINTSGNDFFPFLIEDILYFSSDGHVGFGGLDIFESIFSEKDSSFSRAKNLGKNANTSYDDFAIVFNEDHKTGYLSSNRNGGKGDDDIYYFYREPLTCNQLIKGSVFDKKSNEKLENATITISYEDADSTTLATNPNGGFEIEIPCNKSVQITASKEGFIEMSKPLTTTLKDGEIIQPVDFGLNKIEDIIVKDDDGIEKIKLDPIFFDYDKWDITESAKNALRTVAEVMTDLPKMIIKIEAHTDSRGSDSYNLELSDKRAKATQAYLFTQGISKNRIISAIGYGETQPLNKCMNGVKCTEQEHNTNRRSDFLILER